MKQNKMIEVTSSQLGNRKKKNLQENSKKVKKKFESIHFHYDSVTINELKVPLFLINTQLIVIFNNKLNLSFPKVVSHL